MAAIAFFESLDDLGGGDAAEEASPAQVSLERIADSLDRIERILRNHWREYED